jgi:hypothetical protein
MSHRCQSVNDALKRHLRNAAVTALQEGDDNTAQELLNLMLRPEPEPTPIRSGPLALAGARELPPGPAHSCYFWAQLIRERFLPFMAEHGRNSFTSFEVLKWLEGAGPFTDGDLGKHSDGTIVWRSQASDALSHLKGQGVVVSAPKSKIYAIAPQPSLLCAVS